MVMKISTITKIRNFCLIKKKVYIEIKLKYTFNRCSIFSKNPITSKLLNKLYAALTSFPNFFLLRFVWILYMVWWAYKSIFREHALIWKVFDFSSIFFVTFYNFTEIQRNLEKYALMKLKNKFTELKDPSHFENELVHKISNKFGINILNKLNKELCSIYSAYISNLLETSSQLKGNEIEL